MNKGLVLHCNFLPNRLGVMLWWVALARSLSYGDVVFGVWSGREYTTRRVLSQAATWMQLVPEVHVYSDQFLPESIDRVLDESNFTNIVFHEFGHRGGHLIGSEWEHRWYYAQTRHLLTMADLYERFPNKSWYIWGDDDTYFYPESIIEFLEDKDPHDMKVFGVVYCAWDSVASNLKPHRSCHPFCQGGAGAFFSHSLMAAVGPYLRNCSEMFNDPNFAGSMRLALCIERFVGTERWNMGDAPENCGRLHSQNPLIETENGVLRPLSFHRMRHVLLYQIWNATESVWIDGAGRARHVNWDNITMSRHDVGIGGEGRRATLHWGFRFRPSFLQSGYVYAESQPEPVFAPGDTEKVTPIMFEQMFQFNVTLRYICDDRLGADEMIVDSYFVGEREGTAFRVACQPSRLLPNDNRGRPPLRKTEMGEDMLTE